MVRGDFSFGAGWGWGGRLSFRSGWRLVWALLATLCLMGTAAKTAEGALFRIGTGGQTGVYYPIGRLIAQGITAAGNEAAEVGAGLNGTIGVAHITAGSVANAQAVAGGEIEAGLVQADVAHRAVNGLGEFTDNPAAGQLRAVASLYPEKLQLVTRRDAGITSLAELRGKRFAIDEIGSGTLAVVRIVLATHGISEEEFAAVYLKPNFTSEKMVTGELQGFAMMAGVPMDAVTQLAPLGLHLLPIAAEPAATIASHYPFLVPGTIPAGVYPGVAETPTLEVHALLVVNELLDKELVYRVTRALWRSETEELLRRGHPLGKEITLASALAGISIPLHPGAARFYREQGLLP